MRSFMICDRRHILLGDVKMEKKMVTAFSTHGREDRYVQGLVVTPERKRKFRRPKFRWQDTIKIDLKGTGYDKIDWIHLTQDREEWLAVLNMLMNLPGIHTAENFWTSCGAIGFSRPWSYSLPSVLVYVICVLVYTVFCIVCTVFFIVSFMYIYSYLFCLYWCKDYCHYV